MYSNYARERDAELSDERDRLQAIEDADDARRAAFLRMSEDEQEAIIALECATRREFERFAARPVFAPRVAQIANGIFVRVGTGRKTRRAA